MNDAEMSGQIAGWVVLAAVLLLVPLWRIYRRAGLAPVTSLLVLVPIAGVILTSLVLALSRWPAIEAPRAEDA